MSHKISVESIEEVSSVLKRAPVIWDNIHANDYDPQRLFLGPYKVCFYVIIVMVYNLHCVSVICTNMFFCEKGQTH